MIEDETFVKGDSFFVFDVNSLILNGNGDLFRAKTPN